MNLIPCLQGTGDGSQLPQLIDYLAHNPRITLDAAQQDFLAERCVIPVFARVLMR